MILNRRCSPDDLNGKRFVRVQFKKNASELSGTSNWKIINLFDNSVVASFTVNNVSNVDLGWFKPGEGILYKITPA